MPWAGEGESQREGNDVCCWKKASFIKQICILVAPSPLGCSSQVCLLLLTQRGRTSVMGPLLGCQAGCPQSRLATCITTAAMLRGCTRGEHRGAGVPGFAMWLLMLSWLLATGAREKKTIRDCTAIKQPPNCSATYSSSAAF